MNDVICNPIKMNEQLSPYYKNRDFEGIRNYGDRAIEKCGKKVLDNKRFYCTYLLSNSMMLRSIYGVPILEIQKRAKLFNVSYRNKTQIETANALYKLFDKKCPVK